MPNALRTATPMGDWRSFKFVCESPTAGVLGIKDAIAAGVPYLYRIHDVVGAVLESADVGEEAVLIYHAEKIMVTKAEAQADIFYPGDRVYWVPNTRLVTPTYGAGNWWIGIATEFADHDEEFVEIDLCGNKTEVEAAL